MIWKKQKIYKSWNEYKEKIDFLEMFEFEQNARKTFLGGRK